MYALGQNFRTFFKNLQIISYISKKTAPSLIRINAK